MISPPRRATSRCSLRALQVRESLNHYIIHLSNYYPAYFQRLSRSAVADLNDPVGQIHYGINSGIFVYSLKYFAPVFKQDVS